jgi:magnesium-transporting ATPase (P-type)
VEAAISNLLTRLHKVPFIESWLTYILLFNNIVPISLYVTVGIVNTIQAKIMQADKHIGDEFRELSSLARNTNLNSNLGQVKFVLADKTGTFTSGASNLKYISANNKIFSLNRCTEGVEFFHHQRYSKVISQRVWAKKDLLEDLNYTDPESCTESNPTTDLLIAMAACNSILERPGKAKQYVSVSSDEIALVEGASRLGYSLERSDMTKRIVSLQGELTHFTVLHEIPFTSSRGRMSIILKSPEGRIILLCKGAPEFILKRLKSGDDVQRLAPHINLFARAGHRVLAFASV